MKVVITMIYMQILCVYCFDRLLQIKFKSHLSHIFLKQIEKIRIGHDGSKPGSGWFLDEVSIEIPSTGEHFIFASHRWLDSNEDDGQIEVDLEPTDYRKGSASK